MSLVNLLPDDYMARRAQKRSNLLCAGLFCVVMSGVLTAAGVSEARYRNTRDVSERVNTAYADAQKLIEQLRTLEAAKQKMVAKADLTAHLLERAPRSYLMATVTNALPPGASLREFVLKCERKETTVVVGKGKTQFDAAAKRKKAESESHLEISIVVTGMAATDVEVARFIAAMARCPMMDTVDLVYSQEKEFNKCTIREFQVVLTLRRGADVRDAAEDSTVARTDRPPAPAQESESR